MCDLKPLAKSKADRLIDAIDRLNANLERVMSQGCQVWQNVPFQDYPPLGEDIERTVRDALARAECHWPPSQS